MERLASNGEPFIFTFNNALKKQNSLQERKFAAGVKKSKEVVKNWNQRFPDTKALISIVNFGKGSE